MSFILSPGIGQRDNIPIYILKEPFRFGSVEQQEEDKKKESNGCRYDYCPVPVIELRVPWSLETHVENIV